MPGNNPNGNPIFRTEQRPGTPWQPGQSGNPNTPTFSPDVRQQFLDLLYDAHAPAAAARILGLRPMTPYDWRSQDPIFAAEWDAARNLRGDWYEERIRLKANGEAPPGADTLAIIIGAKMTGRFIEPQYAAKLAININVNRPFQDYTADQLRALIAKLEAPVIEGEVVEVKALPEATETKADST